MHVFLRVDPAGNELEEEGQQELEQVVQNSTDEVRQGTGGFIV